MDDKRRVQEIRQLMWYEAAAAISAPSPILKAYYVGNFNAFRTVLMMHGEMDANLMYLDIQYLE